jgi:hypothetical protein
MDRCALGSRHGCYRRGEAQSFAGGAPCRRISQPRWANERRHAQPGRLKGLPPRIDVCHIAEPDCDTLLRTIEDFEATLAEFQSDNVVLATTVLLRRLAEIEASARELGDPILIAMVEKLQRHLTTGKGLDG